MSQPVASCGGRPGGYHPWRSEVEGSHHLWCFRAFLPALVPPSWSTTSESQSRCHWWSHSENNSSKRCTRRKEADSKVNTTSLTTNFSRPWSFPPCYTTLACSTPSFLSRSWPHMTVVSNSSLAFHPCWQGTFMKYILHGIRSAQNVHISTHVALFLSRKKRNQKEIFIQMTVKISTNLFTYNLTWPKLEFVWRFHNVFPSIKQKKNTNLGYSSYFRNEHLGRIYFYKTCVLA